MSEDVSGGEIVYLRNLNTKGDVSPRRVWPRSKQALKDYPVYWEKDTLSTGRAHTCW
jgi:hypothetical protein